MSVLSSPRETRDGASRTWFGSAFTVVSGLVRLLSRSVNPRPVDPIDLHVRRLIKLHGDRISTPDRLAAASLADMSADARRQLIDRINRDLQIEPLLTDQIAVVCD